MIRKRGAHLFLLLLLVLSLCACKSKEQDKKGDKTMNSLEQSNQQEEEETEKDTEKVVEDTVILTPDGGFLSDSKNSETEKGNTPLEKDDQISGNNNFTSDRTESQIPTGDSDKGKTDNPFNLDKDGDGFADGWY